MSEYILLEPIDKGYFDPATGRSLTTAQVERRLNRKGIDEFDHAGIEYPNTGKLKVRFRAERIGETSREMLLEVEESAQVVLGAVADLKSFNAKVVDQKTANEFKDSLTAAEEVITP